MKRHAMGLVALAAGGLLVPGLPASAERVRSVAWCGKTPGGARNAVWLHREALARRGGFFVTAGAAHLAQDVGDIAVLQDAGDLALIKRLVDLAGKGVEFAPQGAGHSARSVDLPVVADAGTALVLGDDDSTSVQFSFGFPFYGQTYNAVFVNSDGNLTFGVADSASTPRSLSRFLEGPPRIAPLFSDLDPSAGGTVRLTSGPDRLTVTWAQVPQYGITDRNTFSVTLFPSGVVQFAYSAEVTDVFSEGVVGIAPGNAQDGLTPVDMSAAATSGGGALAETFRDEDTLDEIAVARRFYQTHPDAFFQLTIFTNRRLVSGSTVAFERTLRNSITGLGIPVVDFAAEYGSGGSLESFVMMDNITQYSEPFDARVPGIGSGLSVMGEETGHRWLAQAVFRDGATGTNSRELLGRDDAHWSFYLDSDASHLEGNDIEDLGGGQFRTTAVGQRYSPLDQYLMGLRSPQELPPFFFVRNAVGLPADTSPRVGATFNGTRRDVTLDELVAAMGPRNPAADQAPRTFRQAFIFVSVGGPANPEDVAKVDRFRAAWIPFFAASTGGRGAITTNLN